MRIDILKLVAAMTICTFCGMLAYVIRIIIAF